MLTLPRILRRSNRIVVFALVLMLGASMGLGAALLFPRHQTNANAQGGLVAGLDDFASRAFNPDKPLMVLGDPMQLSAPEAAAKAQRPIYLPNMVPGEDQTPEAWYSNVTGQIDIRYGDVLVLVFESWAAGQDPAKAYAREAKDWGGNSTEIGGHPAWVVEAKDDSGIPMIHVTIDSWDIALYGRMSEDQLGSIAANLQRVESSN